MVAELGAEDQDRQVLGISDDEPSCNINEPAALSSL